MWCATQQLLVPCRYGVGVLNRACVTIHSKTHTFSRITNPPQAFAYGAAVDPSPSPQPALPSPSPAAPIPSPSPVPRATTDNPTLPSGRPIIGFVARLPNYSPETFDVLAKAAYVAALQVAAGVPVDVHILSITRGSVLLETAVVFAAGQAEAARRLQDQLALSPSSVFPAATYGAVSVSGGWSRSVSKPPVGAIVGGTVGGFFGLVIIVGVVTWLVLRARKRNAGSPTSVNAPLSNNGV